MNAKVMTCKTCNCFTAPYDMIGVALMAEHLKDEHDIVVMLPDNEPTFPQHPTRPVTNVRQSL